MKEIVRNEEVQMREDVKKEKEPNVAEEYIQKIARVAGLTVLKSVNRYFTDLTLMEYVQVPCENDPNSKVISIPQMDKSVTFLRACSCEEGASEIMSEATIIVAHTKVDSKYLELLDFENLPEGANTKDIYLTMVTTLNYDWVRFTADNENGDVFENIYETLFSDSVKPYGGVLLGVFRPHPALKEIDHVNTKRLQEYIRSTDDNSDDYYSYFHYRFVTQCINDAINRLETKDPAFFLRARDYIAPINTIKEPDMKMMYVPNHVPFSNIAMYVPSLVRMCKDNYSSTYLNDIKLAISISFKSAMSMCEIMLDKTTDKNVGKYYLSLLHDIQDLHYMYRREELGFSQSDDVMKTLYNNITRYWFTGVHAYNYIEEGEGNHSWDTCVYPNVGSSFKSGYGLGMYAKFVAKPFSPNIADFLTYEIDKSVYEDINDDADKRWECVQNETVRILREDIQTAYIMAGIEFDVDRGGNFKLNALVDSLTPLEYIDSYIKLTSTVKKSINRFVVAITLMVKELEIFNKGMNNTHSRGLRIGELSNPNICSVNMTEFLIMFEASKYLIAHDFLGFTRMCNKYPEIESVINVYLNKVIVKGSNILVNMDDYCANVKRSAHL